LKPTQNYLKPFCSTKTVFYNHLSI